MSRRRRSFGAACAPPCGPSQCHSKSCFPLLAQLAPLGRGAIRTMESFSRGVRQLRADHPMSGRRRLQLTDECLQLYLGAGDMLERCIPIALPYSSGTVAARYAPAAGHGGCRRASSSHLRTASCRPHASHRHAAHKMMSLTIVGMRGLLRSVPQQP